jgi:predicted ABC-type ATPase
MPSLLILAGPNGVGKKTCAARYLPETIRELEFVNADLIARGISPYAPERAAMDAGRIALERIRHLIASGTSFTWETTLSGRTAVRWLQSAKDAGYTIKCYFLWVRDVETTLKRIRQRVQEGWHNIDADVSQRRFFKTIENFVSIYRPLCDSWKLIANDDLTPRLLAVGKGARLITRDRKAWETISKDAHIT